MIDMLPHKLARARYYDSDAAMAAACAPFMQAKTAPMAETAPSRG